MTQMPAGGTFGGRDRVATAEAPGVVAQPDRVAAWMELARPGDEFVYATRLRLTTLPEKSAGAAAMRALAGAGLVLLFQRGAGDSEGRWRNYVARRTARPMPIVAAGTSAAATDPVTASAAVENAVLAVLTRRAALARPCPSLRDLARLTGFDSAACDAAMHALADAQVIHIGHVPAPTRRVVTIVATGQATGMAK